MKYSEEELEIRKHSLNFLVLEVLLGGIVLNSESTTDFFLSFSFLMFLLIRFTHTTTNLKAWPAFN